MRFLTLYNFQLTPMAYKKDPVPKNEMERLLVLSELDVNYTDLKESFKDLTYLAAKVAGTEISLINLIDSFTMWSLSSFGVEVEQMPRDESVCQHTIMGGKPFEIRDLRLDDRFNTNDVVAGPLGLRYYYGIPLEVSDGINIGSLCVMDSSLKSISKEKVELLEIIAENVVNRLKSFRKIAEMEEKVKVVEESKKKVAHDIRGPISGIIGLSELMSSSEMTANCAELRQYIGMINSSSRSLLELADEILSDGTKVRSGDHEFNLGMFRDKLEHLYCSQATYKDVKLTITADPAHLDINFSKNKLMQIAGNLISNAIKFTGIKGQIDVSLEIEFSDQEKILKIEVSDTGVGIIPQEIDNILSGKIVTTSGTSGEKGYGFGLNLVVHLVEMLKGQLTINSIPGKGSTFSVLLPQLKVS